MPEVPEVSQLAKSDFANVNILQSGGEKGSKKHGGQIYIVDDLQLHKVYAWKFDPKQKSRHNPRGNELNLELHCEISIDRILC